MTELTHHDADDGFHEIQLSGKQLVFAFMLTATVAVFIFLLGVQVGRNAKTAARVDDLAEAASPASPGGAVTAAQPMAPPSIPASPVSESPKTADKFSYPNLDKDKAPQDKLAKPEPDPPPPPASAKSPGAAPAPAPKEPVKEVARETPKTPAAAEPVTPEKSAPSAGARPGVWVVQLVALKDRAAATAVVQRLSAKGYPAFVVSPSPGKPAIYRVQVGRYNDRHEAEQVAKRLEKEEQFKPWISH